MAKNEAPSPFAGDVTIARERFLRFAEAVASHLPAENINCLAFTLCVHLDGNDCPAWLEQWKEEREAEENGSLKPASDAEWNAFLKSIGATGLR